MTKAAGLPELNELHAFVAKSLTTRIKQDMEDNLPTDAATLGAAIKFLKDNNVSADPADKDDLLELRESFAEQSRKRKERRSNVLSLVSEDLKDGTGG